MSSAPDAPEKDRQQRILDAAIRLLATRGISGVSMRAVAAEAGVALGLVNYYFADKSTLIEAALLRIEAEDVELVTGDPDQPAEEQLRAALRRIVEPAFLTTEYLSLRLQLWSLAQVEERYAEINAEAQQRYRDGLADLIAAARPDLTDHECATRAADVDVIQNGIWLTALLGLDREALLRSVERCEQIALAS